MKIAEEGYTLIPLIDPNQLPDVRARILEAVSKSPEMKQPNPTQSKLSMGLGFLGNPSAYHHPDIRKLQSDIYDSVKKYFNATADETTQSNIEQIPDRLMIRPFEQKVSTGKKWHRDICPLNPNLEDLVLGGWLNLDLHPQPFKCVPRSQLRQINGIKGFCVLPKDEMIRQEDIENVQVPPGKILIFNETMIHAISPTNPKQRKTKTPSMRIFSGFRLTNQNTPYKFVGHKTTKEILLEQGVPPLKSGQSPEMYAKLHWTNWRKKIEDFSEIFHEKCIEQKKVQSGSDKGTSYAVVHSPMKSLEEYGLEKFTEYSPEELVRYTPQPIIEPETEEGGELIGPPIGETDLQDALNSCTIDEILYVGW
jgi:hypothetical protein